MPEVTSVPIETLVLADFTQTPNTTTGVLQTVLEHIVPRNEARALLRYPGRLTFGKLDVIVGDTTTTYPLLSTLVRSRNFPTPAVVYRGTTAGGLAGATLQTYVTSAPGAGQFTVTGNSIVLGTAMAATDSIWVYYAFSDGRYTVEVFTPNERRHDTYANGSILKLNSAPQDDVNSVFAIGANTPMLPQDTAIRVQVSVTDAQSLVNFDSTNPYTNIELPFTRAPLAAIGNPEAQMAGIGA